MRFPRLRGSTSNKVRVFVPDNTATNGAGLTGLVFGSTNLAISYVRSGDASGTQYTGANIETITTIGTYQAPSTSSKIRFKAVDATNFPGLYELHFHDSSTAFGTGDTSDSIEINILELTTTALKIGPNMALIPLVPWNYQDGNMGLTGLTGLTAPTAGALPTSGAGSNQISLTSGAVTLGGYASGEDPATLLLTNPANKLVTDSSGRIQVQPGTAAGQLDLSSGAIKIQNGLRKNVALAGFQFSMALSLNGLNPDHYTPATGKTVTATRSIDGGAFAACANAVVELANGDYKIDLAGSDLNGSTIMLEFTASACDTVRYNLVTTP